MSQRLIPLGRAPDPRLESLSLMHDTRLALEFGALADRGIVAANGLIGQPLRGAQVWPDGLTALDRAVGQAIQFDSNFGISETGAFVALFGVTVPPSVRQGAWLKLGTAANAPGAGFAFGLGWSGSEGFQADNAGLVGLFEHKAWVYSGVGVPDGFRTVAFAYNGSNTLTFYIDGAQVASVAGSAPYSVGQLASFGGYTGSASEHRYTGCKLHFCVLANLRSGASNFADIAASAAELYPAGEYVPNVSARNVIYSLPSFSAPTIDSITASNVTSSGARITLGLTR